MDPNNNPDPRVTAALIAAAVSIVVMIPGLIVNFIKHRRESSLSRKSELFINILLSKSLHAFVPFRIIKHHIGGFADDELRQLLVRSGAIRVADVNMVEYWVLYKRLGAKDKEDLLSIKIPSSSVPPVHRLFPLQVTGAPETKNV